MRRYLWGFSLALVLQAQAGPVKKVKSGKLGFDDSFLYHLAIDRISLNDEKGVVYLIQQHDLLGCLSRLKKVNGSTIVSRDLDAAVSVVGQIARQYYGL